MSDSLELDELVQSQNPFLIGIRHHSPACAVRMADWLESFGPEVILLELPVDFMPWLEWLSHPELQAPVALSASSQGSICSESFHRVGRWQEGLKVGEFLDWYARARELGLKFGSLPQALYRRRIHGNNTVTRELDSRTDYIKVLKAALDRRRQT